MKGFKKMLSLTAAAAFAVNMLAVTPVSADDTTNLLAGYSTAKPPAQMISNVRGNFLPNIFSSANQWEWAASGGSVVVRPADEIGIIRFKMDNDETITFNKVKVEYRRNTELGSPVKLTAFSEFPFDIRDTDGDGKDDIDKYILTNSSYTHETNADKKLADIDITPQKTSDSAFFDQAVFFDTVTAPIIGMDVYSPHNNIGIKQLRLYYVDSASAVIDTSTTGLVSGPDSDPIENILEYTIKDGAGDNMAPYCEVEWAVNPASSAQGVEIDGDKIVIGESWEGDELTLDCMVNTFDGEYLEKTFTFPVQRTTAEDKNAVNAVADSLNLADILGGQDVRFVRENLNLPVDGGEAYSNVSIAWKSSSAKVVASSGTVTRPKADTKITLTAVVSCGAYSVEKTFEPFTVQRAGWLVNLAQDSHAVVKNLSQFNNERCIIDGNLTTASASGNHSTQPGMWRVQINEDKDSKVTFNKVKLWIWNPAKNCTDYHFYTYDYHNMIFGSSLVEEGAAELFNESNTVITTSDGLPSIVYAMSEPVSANFVGWNVSAAGGSNGSGLYELQLYYAVPYSVKLDESYKLNGRGETDLPAVDRLTVLDEMGDAMNQTYTAEWSAVNADDCTISDGKIVMSSNYIKDTVALNCKVTNQYGESAQSVINVPVEYDDSETLIKVEGERTAGAKLTAYIRPIYSQACSAAIAIYKNGTLEQIAYTEITDESSTVKTLKTTLPSAEAGTSYVLKVIVMDGNMTPLTSEVYSETINY